MIVFIKLRRTLPSDDLSQGEPGSSLLRVWGISSLLTFCVIAAIIIGVNPYGGYGSDYYPPRIPDARRLKLDLYAQQETIPDILIMGSSRAFTISPQYITYTLGYSAFNASVEGGNIDDTLYIATYALEHFEDVPSVMLVDVVVDEVSGERYAERWSPRIFPYLPPQLVITSVWRRVTGLMDIQQLADSLSVVRRDFRDDTNTPLRWQFLEDGQGVFGITEDDDLDTAVDRAIRDIGKDGCTPERIEQWTHFADQLVDLAVSHRISLIFYSSPFHPRYYEARIGGIEAQEMCFTFLEDYVKAAQEKNGMIFYLNFSQLQSLEGSANEEGYYDHFHLTPYNSNRLVAAATETIHLAMDLAKNDSP